MSVKPKTNYVCILCDQIHEAGPTCPLPSSFAAPTGLDDALGILKNISKEYQRFCDVMLTMPERRNELEAGSRFMDGLENLRDELLKRKSANAAMSDCAGGKLKS